MTRHGILAVATVVSALLGACEHDVVVIESPFVIVPPPFPDLNQAQRELGRLLFFEKELSGNRQVACSSCHVVFLQATEPVALSIGMGGTGVGPTRSAGASGVTLARNTPDLFLRSEFSVDSLFWDGRLERLENGTIRAPIPIPSGLTELTEVQALMPLVDADEMLGTPDQAGNDIAALATGDPVEAWRLYVHRLMVIPGYPELFAAAFPERQRGFHDITHVARAIVAFERALWERFDTDVDVQGLVLSFSSASSVDVALANLGSQLFHGDARCVTCHQWPLLEDRGFHNIGVPQFGPGKDDSTGLDFGRFGVTGVEADRFGFSTPMLRNCALTGPYMHNGAFATLEEVVRHHLDPEASLRAYTGASLPPELQATIHDDDATLDAIAAGIDPDVLPNRTLSDDEILALVEFLKTLTSELELTLTPESGVPSNVPSGLAVDVWPGGPQPSRLANYGF